MSRALRPFIPRFGSVFAFLCVFLVGPGLRAAQAHEVYGVLVRDEQNQVLLRNFFGITEFGGLQAYVQPTAPLLHVNWLEPDGAELNLVGATGHQLVVSVADTTVLGTQVFGAQFNVKLFGKSVGHTTVRLGFEFFGLPEFTSVDLDVDVLATTGVGSQGNGLEVRLSSVTNPARTAARVGYSTTRAGTHRFEIVDLQGRVLRDLQADSSVPGQHELTLDVTGLDPGLYFVRLAGEGPAMARKFVVSR